MPLQGGIPFTFQRERQPFITPATSAPRTFAPQKVARQLAPPLSRSMLKNVLLRALRDLARNKLYTLINLLGLATGIACFVLIGLYVRYQRSFDRFVPHAERVYRVVGAIE